MINHCKEAEIVNKNIDKFISLIESCTGQSRQVTSTGYKLYCPAHDGHSAALSVSEDSSSRVLIHCHAGCDPEKILARIGWKWVDFYQDSISNSNIDRNSISVQPRYFLGFCEERHLDAASLKAVWKIHEVTWRGRPALKYPTELSVDRIKFLDKSKPKYLWAEAGKGHPHWYGWNQATAIEGSVLFIVNGEPSVWACHQEGIPAVCPCGEGTKLSEKMLEELKNSTFLSFKVVFDLDKAGKTGARKTVKALLEYGIEAEALLLPEVLGEKADVEDLHRLEGKNLMERLLALEKLPDPPPSGPILKKFSEIEPEDVKWLWEPYIPLGKLVLFQGDPGTGKTWAAMKLCADITRRGFNVIFASLEDSWGDTLRPRAEKVGCDLSRLVALIGRREEDGTERSLTLEDHLDIERSIVKVKPALLVLDPISAWLGAGADMNKANEVRDRLIPMTRLAEHHGVTVLLLQHLTKARTDRAIYRGQGSIDFGAAARSILLFGETRPQDKAMVQIKNAFGPKGKAFSYSIDDDGFHWLGETEATASDLLEPESSTGERSALDDAIVWLESELSQGPQEASTLQKRYESETGYSAQTLRRALKSLGGKTIKEGFGKGAPWKWEIPINENVVDIDSRATEPVSYGDNQVLEGLGSDNPVKDNKENVPVSNEDNKVSFTRRT